MTPRPVPLHAELRRTAAAWFRGTRPGMLVYAGTGAVVAGLDREVRECLALVESGDRHGGPVDEGEHERLLVLLHRIEPEVALLRARDIGREHGEAAVAWWQQDTLGGRATGDATETARRVLQGIEDGDPEVLDALPGPDGYTPAALQEDCDWHEPVLGDEAMHERWRTVGARLWDGYAAELQAAVHTGVVRACRQELGEPDGTPAVEGRSGERVTTALDERHLARARHAGAWVALAEATALRLAPEDAWSVVHGRSHRFAPPTLNGARPDGVRASALAAAAAVCEGADVVDVEHSTAEEVAGIHAKVVRAWQAGRDAIWPAALKAAALRTLGSHEPAQILVAVVEDRLRSLAEDINGRPDAGMARPYLRPTPDTTGPGAGGAVPDGWVTRPIGRWFGTADHGVAAEVVYDPRRFDVMVTHPATREGEGLGEAQVWERLDTDGVQAVWVRDRIDAARATLARLDQRTPEAGVAGPGQPAGPPPRGLEL